MTLLERTAQAQPAGVRPPTDRHMQNTVALSLLIVFLLIGILSSAGVSSTTDEPVHYAYAFQQLGGDSTRIDESSMPVSILNALPKWLAARLPDSRWKVALSSFFVARMMTMLFSTAVAYLIFYWSRSLYGFIPAVFSMFLYVLDPNVIAHSQLITTDIYVAGFTALTFYFLWRFANGRRTRDGLLCALALAGSQLSKYSAAPLFPLCVVALILHDWPSLRSAVRSEHLRPVLQYAKKILLYIVVVAVVNILIINLGFGFSRTLTQLKDYHFQSDFFQAIQSRLPGLGQLPIPLPYPYVDGLDWGSYTEQTGNRFGNVYLLGQTRKPEGFIGYYFVANLLKEPLATQIIVTSAVVAALVTRKRRVAFLKDSVFLLLPVAFYTIYYNFFFRHQVGYRYLLMVFPLLCVLSGTLFVEWRQFSTWAKAASIGLLAYLAISVLSYFPNYIPYFNELVWDKTQTYKYLADSNLDWGQGADDLQRYLAAHPDAIYDPASVQPGLLVVGGSDLVGILTRPEQYAWLRNNFKPVGTIAFSYFVYRISPDEIARLCASSSYCK